MSYPTKYTDIYKQNYSNDSVFDLQSNQIEKPIEDLTFCERLSLDARYGISSDIMLPSENQDESEVQDWRVRSDHDIRVSLMDQIEMRTNVDARRKAVLFNPEDYVGYESNNSSKTNVSTNLNTSNAND